MNNLADQYDQRYTQFASFKQQNEELTLQERALTDKMSKPKILSVLDARIQRADTEGKQLEKTALKGAAGGDMRDFIEGYLEKRK